VGVGTIHHAAIKWTDLALRHGIVDAAVLDCVPVQPEQLLPLPSVRDGCHKVGSVDVHQREHRAQPMDQLVVKPPDLARVLALEG